MSNIYQFFCDKCSYKRLTTGTDIKDLIQVKTSDIPRGKPYIDKESKKVIVPPAIKRMKQFKCPNCGFTIKPKKIKEVKDEQTNLPS